MMEKDKDLGIFQNKMKLEINDCKISAIGCIDNYIIIGDEKGNISSYQINTNGQVTLDHQQFVVKGKVEQIKCLSHLNLAYVLINGNLFGYQIPRLDPKFKFENKDQGSIYRILLNDHPSCLEQIMIITKKRRIKCFEYNPEIAKLKDMKCEDLLMFELTEVIEWYGHWFCYSAKKKIFLINVQDGMSLTQEIESTSIRNVGGNWIIYTNSIGLLMEQNIPKQQNPIMFSSKPLLNMGVYKNYIISLHDSLIGVFDSNDSTQVQEIHFEHGSAAKFLTVGQKRLFYVVSSFSDKKDVNSYQIWELKELAFEKQITKLLSENKIDEALNILNNNISSSNEEKPKKLEQFFIDCAWISLRKCSYDKAYHYSRLTNVNPFEFMYLFKDMLSIRILHEEYKNSAVGSIYQIESLATSPEEMNKAYKMLLNILNDKRIYFITNYEISKDGFKKINFIYSDNALINLSNTKSDFPLNVTFECINTTLIKVLVRCKENSKKLWEIIDYEYFSCNWDDTESFLIKENTDESKIAYAYLNEKLMKYEDALKIWQEYGNKDNSNAILSREAMERTKVILKKCQDKRLFHDYIQWILCKYSQQAFDLFLSTEIVPAEYFFTTIIGAVEKNVSNLNLREKFLEYYIENGCTNERYHTILAEIYVEKIFKIKKPESQYEVSGADEKEINYHLDKLNKILHTSAYYNKNHILDKLKDTWLTEQEIYLYSKLDMDTDALIKLIKIGERDMNFTKVEKYCDDMVSKKPDIFADLFTLLSDNYNMQFNNSKNSNSQSEKQISENLANIYHDEMLEILRKYGDKDKLDPFVVLEKLPLDWMISDSSLYEYLTNIMKNYIHVSNNYKISRSLSEMALIYKEKELLDSKDKSVTVSNETPCELCKKKIGNTIFCVYPNMKIYHHKCAYNNPHVDPTTKVDFTKNKII